MSLNITVLYGSLRSDREGIRAARFIMNALKERGHHVEFVDALEVGLPLLDRLYSDYEKGQAPEVLERLAALYHKTDAYVMIAGEYNHGIQPGLKNLLDHFYVEYAHRPAGIVGYSIGSFAGIRAASSLRLTLAALKMITIPSLLLLPEIQNTFDESGVPADEVMHKRGGKFCDELEWYGAALKKQRAERTL